MQVGVATELLNELNHTRCAVGAGQLEAFWSHTDNNR